MRVTLRTGSADSLGGYQKGISRILGPFLLAESNVSQTHMYSCRCKSPILRTVHVAYRSVRATGAGQRITPTRCLSGLELIHSDWQWGAVPIDVELPFVIVAAGRSMPFRSAVQGSPRLLKDLCSDARNNRCGVCGGRFRANRRETGTGELPALADPCRESLDGKVADCSRPAVEFPGLPVADVRLIDLDAGHQDINGCLSHAGNAP